ncbi:hypothetical protein O9X90_21310 [Agrobacterium leguminum]|uniref:N,N-dimethylformamidase beta subunit family domain-containing protein n=1 Tax=Agrobacterium TaxID=357 RepID=UPI0015720AC3|nr:MULTISPECIES: N,N-dimethylformamidase beta subunit family domain-containing protein [Agrobacterium]MCZ7934868.1 hypothetical protein [Agrobacterium leguminum]NSX94161.1 LamG domain-containing protein [Agrobacterium tumefaciens]NTA35505.1 LamG domain-containing protein [Agrobacterium salinitolerans]
MSTKNDTNAVWPTVVGYADRMSVRAGETIRFMVSSDRTKSCQVHLVRLLHGAASADPGFASEDVDHPINGTVTIAPQPTFPGSLMVAKPSENLAPNGELTFQAYIYPTQPAGGQQQTIVSWSGARTSFALGLDENGRAGLSLSDAKSSSALVSDKALEPHRWYRLTATVSVGAQKMALYCVPLAGRYVGRAGSVARVPTIDAECSTGVCELGSDQDVIALAAEYDVTGSHRRHYNGKIEAPRFFSTFASDGSEIPHPVLLGWDFSEGIGPKGVSSTSAPSHGKISADGTLVNTPARCATGHEWTIDAPDFRAQPQHFGAIHFHDDDVTDVGWQPSINIELPRALPSDVYALRIKDGPYVEHIPFFVRPAAGRKSSSVLFLVPTASYLAYSNEHAAHDAHDAQQIVSRIPVIEGADLYLHVHREFGESAYSLHNDGSGVAYCSSRRPILNMRPTHRYHAGAWQFPADLAVIDWLKKSNFDFDVATDHDLHFDGRTLLDNYKVVVTGTHPEYYSREMLDSLEDYVADQGTLMYLGGNGFYWEVSFDPEQPHVMEIRRGDVGNRAWQAAPGELRHATTGRPGGIWRAQGRPPQKLCGVGYAGQGFDRSSYFVQLNDRSHPEVQFIFEGIDPDERIGEFGEIGGGAAGQELDRFDVELGSPPDAWVLATTEGLNRGFVRVSEEILFNRPGYAADHDYKVRGDIVYFRTAGGGAVFSVGSISWAASLSHNGYNNNVARMTTNVARAFVEGLPQSSWVDR